ncbi:MAG TPA: hypothetical protein VK279_08470 [Solirubrobacteraceae bacterium]|nr:hypothetical protein [Solirubrobacteraceae bacterium]
MRRPFAFLAGLTVVVVVGVAAVAAMGSGTFSAPEPVSAVSRAPEVRPVGREPADRPTEDPAEVRAQARALGINPTGPRAVEPAAGETAGADDEATVSTSSPRSRREPDQVSDAELRADLAALRKTVALTGRPRVTADGLAAVPSSAPAMVRDIIAAGNKIALLPYRYGGGHTKDFRDTAYDCSASISYALAAAGLLDEPLASTGFMDWGSPGRGKWVTIYANAGHAFMVVAGLRFDTSGRGDNGTRWQAAPRNAGGFVVRHPPGL